MAMTAELGQRIRDARMRRGITQDELAQSIGGTKSTVSRIESGRRDVKSGELADIADALGVSMRDIVGRRRPLAPLALAYRLGEADVDAPSVAEATQCLQHLLEIQALLDELEIPEPSALDPAVVAFSPTTMDATRAGEELATHVRSVLGLGTQPVGDLDVLIEQWFSIAVVGLPLGDGEDVLSGMSVSNEALRAAVINTSMWPTRQRFTLAHELAHILLDDTADDYHLDTSSVMFGDDPAEVRANAFAAELLAPRAALESWASAAESVTESVFAHLLFTFRVSMPVLAIRLHKLGLIDDTTRDNYRRMSPATLAYRYNHASTYHEMSEDRGGVRPPTRLYERALAAYCDARIGIGPVAAIVGRDESDLRDELAQGGLSPDFGDDVDLLAHL